ncbi:Mfb1p [Lachancea thermotolerans CBS 6340]|uniref:KLTH0E10010p n=1 Tax=Lachancea thermotolerans (strain ATCC 56472 / CBS 6340 / NRRL Y-8284) TaxID=559295 RepID=C5DI63_LACTC|nr:KLTH0E10010p [Lachancea thermotolerans CBS 6340]CAR23474.1 KLTH0E10010p [Lachancea thermotolerans CBS 6340]
MSARDPRTATPSRSLTDLPLDVIMEILFYLPFEDLENVSKTCRTLRVLSNESITYRRTVKDRCVASEWTKRLLFDFLHAIDKKDGLLGFISSERISIVNSLQELQSRFELGNRVPLLPPREMTPLQNSAASDENKVKVSETPCSESSGKQELKPNSFEIPKARLRTGKRDAASLDKEGMAYLQILQGFHRIATNSHKRFGRRNREFARRNPNQESAVPQTPDKEPIASATLTPIQVQSLANEDTTAIDVLKSDENSPDSSHHSRTTSSIFSDTPRLSDLGWSYSEEFKSLESNSDSECGSSDSSSSSKYLRQLQRSNRVSDKKNLYEKLNSRTRKEHEITNNKISEKGSSEKLRPGPTSSKGRAFSQGYLVELERCNTPAVRTQQTAAETTKVSQEFLSRYQEHLVIGTKSSPEVPTQRRSKTKKLGHAPHRRKLIASVTEDNRICYEKL